MPNYNRFYVNFYLKAICNILLFNKLSLTIGSICQTFNPYSIRNLIRIYSNFSIAIVIAHNLFTSFYLMSFFILVLLFCMTLSIIGTAISNRYSLKVKETQLLLSLRKRENEKKNYRYRDSGRSISIM